jgi:tetratricopeptide (TPR) repeat protein
MADERWRRLLTTPERWPIWSVRALLLALPLLVYGGSLGFGLIGLDDQGYYDNPALAGGSWRGLTGIWTSLALSDYAPVSQLTMWLDLALVGDRWWFAHLQQILWFALGAWGVHALVLRLTTSAGLALAISLLYVLHPLGGESVLWLAERKNLVAFALGVWCVERYVAAVRDDGGAAASIGAWALGALALFAKPNAVCLPFLLAAYELTLGSGNRWRRLVRVALPMLLIATFVFIELQFVRSDLDRRFLGGSRFAAILIDGQILLRYLGMILLPQHLTIYYAVPESVHPLPVLLAWMSLAALVLASLKAVRSRALVAFSWLYAGAALAPALNLVPQLAPLADHYLLWALPALLLMGGVLVRDACQRLPPAAAARAAHIVVAGLALFFTLLALVRLPEFKDMKTLYTAAVKYQPESGTNWSLYCHCLLDTGGDFELASRAAERALACADNGRILPENRAMIIVLAALELHRHGDRRQANELVEREVAKLPEDGGRIADIVRAQVALRIGDSQHAIALLQRFYEPSMQAAAALLRKKCRSGEVLPDEQPPMIEIAAKPGAIGDIINMGHEMDNLERQLQSLAYAYEMAGDLEHAFDVAALGVNLSPSCSGMRTLLIDVYRRLHLDAAAARLAGSQAAVSP